MGKDAKLSRAFRVESGKKFRLKDVDPGGTAGLKLEKDHAAEILDKGVDVLAALQDKLYAQDKRALLLVFQAMDAAGKDGTIKHVASGINPQGCQVFAFKRPSAEELDHGYLWRIQKNVPERGRIGIFNRSHYEDVLVARVHPEIVVNAQIPGIKDLKDVDEKFWEKRYRQINDFERYLSETGTTVIKFFLNVSKDEQRKRQLERIDRPEKNWKFNAADVQARNQWDEYQKAYEQAINATATEKCPWYVVPADDKKNMRLIVSAAILHEMKRLHLHWPKLPPEQKAELAKCREMLMDD